jgi:hypothetical protein
MTLWVLCPEGKTDPHVDVLPCPGHIADWPPGEQMSCTVRHELHCPGGRPATPVDAAKFLLAENSYTIRCEACETANCHAGINGGHDGPDNPAVHTRDVWVLTGLTESEAESA